jgi:hypothetical protein
MSWVFATRNAERFLLLTFRPGQPGRRFEPGEFANYGAYALFMGRELVCAFGHLPSPPKVWPRA